MPFRMKFVPYDELSEHRGFAHCSASWKIGTPGTHGSSDPLLSRRRPRSADPLLHLSTGVTQLLQLGSHGSRLRMTGVHLYATSCVYWKMTFSVDPAAAKPRTFTLGIE